MDRIKHHRVWFAILSLIIILLSICLRISHYKSIDYIGTDEIVYREQAKIIAKNTNGGVSSLVNKYNSEQDLWKFPPPSRIGYLHTVSFLMNLLDRYDEHPARMLSIAADILTMIFLVIIGMQFFNRCAVLYALLFFAVSPMGLTVSVHGYQDALLGLLGVSMLYISLIISFRRKSLLLYLLLSLIGMYSITIKEFGILIYSYSILIALINLIFKEKDYKNASILAIIYFSSIIATVFLLAGMLGGLTNLVGIIYNVKTTLSKNYYAAVWQSGPWYLFIRGFWILSPLSYAMFAFSVLNISLINRKKKKGSINLGPIYSILLFILLCIISAILPYSQNYRYLSSIYIFYYLIAGMGFYFIIDYIRGMIRQKPIRVFLLSAFVLTVIFCSSIDFNRFNYIRISYKAYDLPVAIINDLRYRMDYIDEQIR